MNTSFMLPPQKNLTDVGTFRFEKAVFTFDMLRMHHFRVDVSGSQKRLPRTVLFEKNLLEPQDQKPCVRERTAEMSTPRRTRRPMIHDAIMHLAVTGKVRTESGTRKARPSRCCRLSFLVHVEFWVSNWHPHNESK